MWPSIYHAPESLAELHVLLTRRGRPHVRGGTDVIVRLRHGDMRPAALIDLKRVRELSGQIRHDGLIRIGARVTMTTLLGDARIRRWFPALLEAAAVVGSIQIRNRATLVGNVCNASPPPTPVPVLLVHGAVANIAGPSGDRRVPLSEFFVGPGRTVLQHTNLSRRWMCRSRPVPPVRRLEGSPAGAASISPSSTCASCSRPGGRLCLAFGAVAPTPILGIDATGALDGTRNGLMPPMRRSRPC